MAQTDITNVSARYGDIRTLQAVLGLLDPLFFKSEIQDAVFITIDFENGDRIISNESLETINSQIGVAVLNTKEFFSSSLESDDGYDSDNDIRSYNFSTGTEQSRYKASRRFLFGTSVSVNKENKYEILKYRMQLMIQSETKNIFLVGHDLTSDLRAFLNLYPGFEKKYPRYKILDTQRIAGDILPRLYPGLSQSNKNYSLRRVLTFFNCPFKQLHCAGNDANYTLRILLLLAVYYTLKNGSVVTDEQEEIVKKLKKAAYAPLPVSETPFHVAAVDWRQRRSEKKMPTCLQQQNPGRVEKVRTEGTRKREVAKLFAAWSE
ncbi:hypothetical protein TWF481_001744 [Arthrobotrys musiformis]|uniref:Gfd2/YDR514C-like C-terminal domain-containing protein n=1 Tax=Arthrobotrys musiformis TaxID=47236 RepID=A0AAV9VU60_9PEZI